MEFENIRRVKYYRGCIVAIGKLHGKEEYKYIACPEWQWEESDIKSNIDFNVLSNTMEGIEHNIDVSYAHF